jgi:AsmA protein
MPKPIKWILAIVAAMVVCLILAIIIAPMVIDVNKYRPQIEAQVTKATGRPFTLGGEIKPSIFPWVGISLSDLRLGNPSGFKEKDFVSVDFFEARIKLLPILSGNYEFKRFVLKGPRIVIVKQKDGRLNLEGLTSQSAAPKRTAPKTENPAPDQSDGALPIKSLMVAEFAITDGNILYIDHAAGTQKKIENINLTLKDVSLDKPIHLDFSAIADKHPVSLTGSLGPLGPKPGKSPLPIDLSADLLKTLQIKLKGRIDASGDTPRFTLSMGVVPFSARQLLADLGQTMPLEPSDAAVLKKIGLELTCSGSPDAVDVKDGVLILDDSRMTFNAQAKELSKPNLTLTANLDHIDLDRYLPPATETPPTESTSKKEPAKQALPMDYGPLRTLVLDGRITVGELKAKGVSTQNIQLHAAAKNGIFRIDPMDMDLYSGRVTLASTFNVQGKTPRSTVDLDIANVKAGPLLKDFLKKDLIEGGFTAAVKLTFNGDQPDVIRKTLGGTGELKFNDGAIVGIDLANMVRNVTSAFGGAQQTQAKPRTDFSELLVPLSITDGVATIDGSRLNSPLLRILAGGQTDLAAESLNFRIEPKFVATLVGQGDTAEQRSGLTVPVLVTGTYAKPKFAPDLKSLLSTQLPGKEKITEDIEKTKKKVTEDLQKKTQDLFKSLPFGGSKN